MDNINATLKETKKLMHTAESAISENSPLRQELMSTLQSLSIAARSLENFADYLERHPEALLKGKGGRGGQ